MRPLLPALAALLLLFLGLPARAAEALTVKGSDTLVILVQRWAEEYMKTHPEVRVQVTGGGSGTGFAALLNGTTEIAMASRSIKEAEQVKLEQLEGSRAAETVVAKDGVTFYVHESNPVDTLSMKELRAIYQGDLVRWEKLGGKKAPIAIYSRESSSGTYVFVKENLLDDEVFAAEAQTLPGTAAVVNAVAQEPHGIGFGGAAYAAGVKNVSVELPDGTVVEPTLESIQSGAYPLARDLYFYTRGKPSRTAQGFIDFALSPEGQKLVEKLGYFPVKSKK